MTAAISISGLEKTYSNGFQALKGINLEVQQGDFFALLGPNGAGKSTTIGILSSLVNKSGGKVKVFGHDLDTDLLAAKRCIGVVPQLSQAPGAVGQAQRALAHVIGRHEAPVDDCARVDP